VRQILHKIPVHTQQGPIFVVSVKNGQPWGCEFESRLGQMKKKTTYQILHTHFAACVFNLLWLHSPQLDQTINSAMRIPPSPLLLFFISTIAAVVSTLVRVRARVCGIGACPLV
jgi:hypothetical protein